MVCRVLRIKHCICQAMMILFDQPVAINVFCYRFSVASAEAHIKRYFPKCLTTWTTENLPEKKYRKLEKTTVSQFPGEFESILSTTNNLYFTSQLDYHYPLTARL